MKTKHRDASTSQQNPLFLKKRRKSALATPLRAGLSPRLQRRTRRARGALPAVNFQLRAFTEISVARRTCAQEGQW